MKYVMVLTVMNLGILVLCSGRLHAMEEQALNAIESGISEPQESFRAHWRRIGRTRRVRLEAIKSRLHAAENEGEQVLKIANEDGQVEEIANEISYANRYSFALIVERLKDEKIIKTVVKVGIIGVVWAGFGLVIYHGS